MPDIDVDDSTEAELAAALEEECGYGRGAAEYLAAVMKGRIEPAAPID